MPLSVGTKLGPYEILSAAGAGGMGEVYRARDTRLGRIVAIKLLTSAFSRDDDRLRRFELEARNVAALSHPNILAIHDVGHYGDTPYLVTEFLEGDTLRQRLAEGPIPVRKSVEYAQQIAHGLAAAHERGIVHRDLKPENVFLTKDGHVKLLDFGLAKSTANAAEAGSPEGATIASVTQAGMVMGTAGYMAPEQVRAGAVDHRADIFSFGAVLYEMLSGKKAFTGESSVETMNAILKEDPPELEVTALKVSPGLDRIVRHCLEKNPDDRFQSARDLTFALGALSGSESSMSRVTGVPMQRRWSAWLPWVVAALAIIAAVTILLRPAPGKVRQDFAIPVPGEVSFVALSVDGQMLAFVMPQESSGEGELYVQRVGSSTATRLNGTEGAIYPFWSPDNKYLAFFADGKLKKVAIGGGSPQALATVGAPRGGSWGTRDVILYSPDAGGPLWRVDADGTNARPETDKVRATTDNSHRWVSFLPDGEHFIFWSGDFDERPNDTTSGIYASSLGGKEKKLIVPARSSAVLAGGQLLYVDEKGALVALPVDAVAAKVKGQPRIVVDAVGRHPSTYWSSFTAAQNGTLVYQASTGAPTSRS